MGQFFCYMSVALTRRLCPWGPAGGMVVKVVDTPTWPTVVQVPDLVACFLTFPFSLCYSLFKLKIITNRGPEVGIMAVAGLPCSQLRFESQTQWFKLTPGACACVPKIPRGEWRRRECGVTIPPGG